jgi:thiol-disulfide isomerase/thioredoxin
VDTFRTVIRVVGVAGLLGILVVSLLGGGGAPLVPAGTPAPTTRGPTLDGGAFDLGAWRGQPVVVNIWATWCAPCMVEMPGFVDVARATPDVRFVGLAAESTPAAVERVAARLQVPYPLVTIDDATQRAWGATAIPATFIVDANGAIVWSVAGAITASELAGAVARFARAHNSGEPLR